MVRDFIKPEYKVVEQVMSNGKVRCNIYVINGIPDRSLLTVSGYCTFSNQHNTFLYQRHELDAIIQLHKNLQFKHWLREVKEYTLGVMTRPDNYAGELNV